MKKIIALLLVLSLVIAALFTFASCGKDDEEETSSKKSTKTTQNASTDTDDTDVETEPDTEADTEDVTEPDTEADTEPDKPAVSDSAIVGTWVTEYDASELFAKQLEENPDNPIAGFDVDLTGMTLEISLVFNADGTFELSIPEESVKALYTELLTKVIEALGMPIETFLQLQGCESLDEFIENNMTGEGSTGFDSKVGTYSYDGAGKLTLEKTVVLAVELSGDELVIEEVLEGGGTEDSAAFEAMMPMTFHRK